MFFNGRILIAFDLFSSECWNTQAFLGVAITIAFAAKFFSKIF